MHLKLGNITLTETGSEDEKCLLKDFTCLLAVSFGIIDVGLLEIAVRTAALAAVYDKEGGLALAEDGEEFIFSSAAYLQQAREIADLANALGQKVYEAPFPAGQIEQSQRLLYALRDYLNYLNTVAFQTRPNRRGPKKSTEWIIAQTFASVWQELTGQEPSAWIDKYTNKGSGRFYEFLSAYCASVNLEPPHANTVSEWLKPDAQ
jgi:hypothetical protein